jgi:hypothetical protein
MTDELDEKDIERAHLYKALFDELDGFAKRAVALRIVTAAIMGKENGTLDLTLPQIITLMNESAEKVDGLITDVVDHLIGQVEAKNATQN